MIKISKKSKLIIFSVLSILIYTALNIYVAFSLKNILDLVELKNNLMFKNSVLKALLIIFLMSLSYFLKSFMQRRLTAFELGEISEEIYSEILRSAEVNNSGETISFLTNDLNLAISSKINMCFSIVENGVLLIFAIISLYYLDVKIASMVLVFSIILSILPKLFSKGLSIRREVQVKNIGEMNNQISNTLNGIETIKSYSIEDVLVRDAYSFIEKSEKSLFKYSRFSQIANNSLFGITFISQILVIIFTAILILKGYLSIGVILLIGQLMSFIQEPISNILSSKNELNANKEIFKQIEKIKTQDRRYGDKEKNNLENYIVLNNLSFSYGEHQIFSNVNLIFEKNKKYVILGKSGTGKSTLFKLLIGELTPTQGEILIDDIKVKDLNKKAINNIFQKVSQNLFMFSNTLKYNICLYDAYSDEEYKRALINANIYDRINSLPEKSDTIFEESKITLSGGERQRIQLARALLRDSDVFLFDEITSNLDMEHALSVEKTINSLDKTVISIRHKIDESLKYYDEILLLENGSLKKISYEDILEKIY